MHTHVTHVTLMALTFVLIAAPAPAGELEFVITPVVVEGDVVREVGLVTRIDNMAVNNAGNTLVEADTDNSDTDADSVLLANGNVVLREAGRLAQPPGAVLDSFDSVTLNDSSDGGFNFFLDGTSGSDDDSGVYWNKVLVLQESDEAPGLTPGTPLIGFFDVKINNANQLSVVASVDDPNIPSGVDRALYVLELDDNGALIDFTLIAAEADVLPGQVDPIEDFGTSPHETALNDSGDVLYVVELGGPAATDSAVYLNDQLVEQEGNPSIIAGRNWASLSSADLDINNSGDYAFRGMLDGDTNSNLILVKNNQIVIQEGDTLPAIGGEFVFTTFGSGPVEISDAGDVLWYGGWNDPDTDRDSGLFLNNDLLVQEGVTMINGVVVDTLRGIEDGYHMSNDGRHIIFEAILQNGVEGAFVLSFVGVEGDIDGDGDVDLDDFDAYLACVTGPDAGAIPPGCDAADLDTDDDVDFADAAALWPLFGG